MGSVYRGKDLATGQDVAIKILTLNGDDDVARFQREADILSKLDHANVVKYIASGADHGVHYIVQEWVEGITLAAHVRTTGLSANEAIQLASAVTAALSCAHAVGIVHRDVKPANILLPTDNMADAKLVDFGIARLASGGQRLTMTGMLVGTPSYMSPEQAQGAKDIGPPADIWAVGCVLYETLTGQQPFRGDSSLAIRAKVLVSDPAPLTDYCAEATPALVALVSAMLNKVPDKRPTTTDDVLARLRAIGPLADAPKRPRGFQATLTPKQEAVRAAAGPLKCVMMVATPPGLGDETEVLADIAKRHDLQMYVDEEFAVLTPRVDGKAGAMAAARAAVELQKASADAAIGIASYHDQTSMDAALDQMGQAVEKNAVSGMFAAVLDTPAAEVMIDPELAQELDEEFKTEVTSGEPLRVLLGAR